MPFLFQRRKDQMLLLFVKIALLCNIVMAGGGTTPIAPSCSNDTITSLLFDVLSYLLVFCILLCPICSLEDDPTSSSILPIKTIDDAVTFELILVLRGMDTVPQQDQEMRHL
mmetsp:Transcript_30313/g.50363  ORF Transcript_30313/g.50363 Transcript_30313/m.50363 type:complete len:112 (-) Transcript_30313:186-521(-)